MPKECGSVSKGTDIEALKKSFANHLKYTLARDRFTATDYNRYFALALTIRDRLIERWFETQQKYHRVNCKRVYYLSLEFLMGRALDNNVANMGCREECRKAMADFGLDWDELANYEPDAGLGNGGLGRLAACFLDSLATLQIPAVGYGLRYDYGIFKQIIKNGFQLEEPDEWLRYGYPWEICRPEYSFEAKFGGNVEHYTVDGRTFARLKDTRNVVGLPYDIPIVGYGSNNVNTLRLWSAKAKQDFELDEFNSGDYVESVENKMWAENLTKVLYPNDNIVEGKQLRFMQEYFFVSCSVQDIFRRFRAHNKDIRTLPDKVAIQLNDTHPAMAILELMHILLDREKLEWKEAWELTINTFAYTNHTLLPEALEKWPVSLFDNLLPRHLEILYEINSRFLRKVANKYPGDGGKLARMSIVEEGPVKQVRMANLATIGSHSVNGVAAIHSELVKKKLLHDFYELLPERFNNKTNGVTPRRWLLSCNSGLAGLITEKICDTWVANLAELKKLEEFTDDKKFRAQFRAVKRANKERLAKFVKDIGGPALDPDSIFDVHVKRLHEYKRQLLNILHVVILYNRLKENPKLDMCPRTFIYSAKAAPGYYMAKLIIKLIHSVAEVVNNDEDINGKLKVFFIPNYGVTAAEVIIPAADVSEQISCAGMEASGTGNMKLSMNGALTIGTLDGANIEIMEEVGEENIFIFGKTIDEIAKIRQEGYNPYSYYESDAEIKKALDMVFSNFFNLSEPGIFEPIRAALFEHGDRYMHLADMRSYVDCHEKIDRLYKDPEEWAKKAILNVARMGKFSSDRTISEYNDEIWNADPVCVDMRDKKSDTLIIPMKNSCKDGQ